MGEDPAAQRGVWQAGHHRDLDGDHELTGLGSEYGEAEDLVAVRCDQHLHQPARLGQGPGPQDAGHGQGQQAVPDAKAPGLRLVAADPGQFRIGEHAEGDQAVPGGPAAAIQVVPYHAEVVESDMGELRAAGALAHRPYAGRGRGQVLIDLDVAGLGPLHSGSFQPDTSGVRGAADGDEQVGPGDPAATRPGRSGTVACVPRLSKTRSPLIRRFPPSASSTSTVLGAAKRAWPMISSAPLAP